MKDVHGVCQSAMENVDNKKDEEKPIERAKARGYRRRRFPVLVLLRTTTHTYTHRLKPRGRMC